MTIAIVLSSLAVLVVAVLLWARWLSRRRVYWFERLTASIPVNSNWWKEQRAKTGDLLYVAIGDSAAQGIGASRPHRSYVGVIAKHIRSRIPGTLRVVNLGISGATVRIAIEKELPRLAKLRPDILTVSIGANDMTNFDPARFKSEMDELFAALPRHAIVADLPTFYFLPAEKKVRVANAMLRSVAEKHGLTVVPLHATMRRQGIWGVASQFAGDLFHPNDRGYRVWASAFLPSVERRLSEVSPLA
jgi:lysophospholipase L1-like esterase